MGQPNNDLPRQGRRWTATAALLAVLLVNPPTVPAGPPAARQLRARLTVDLGPVRPLKARLSGFEYRALDQRSRTIGGLPYTYTAPPGLDGTQQTFLSRFTRTIRADYANHPTPDGAAAIAAAIVLDQRPDRLETAIALLEAAVAERPDDPVLLSDLAAAYLSSTRPDPPNRYLALDVAARAVQADPSLPEARFNLALAQELCGLRDLAQKSWGSYLRFDHGSGWSGEALEHLQNLREPLPADQWATLREEILLSDEALSELPDFLYGTARETGTMDILGRWAALSLEGRTANAGRELRLAEMIAGAFLRLPYDKTLPDSISTILTASDDTDKTRILRQGHIAYQRAIQLLRAGKFERARSSFEDATSFFDKTGSHLQHWANAFLAELAVDDFDYAKAEGLVGEIRLRANLTRYGALNARLLALDGRIAAARGDLAAARTTLLAADRAAGLAREHELAGLINLLLVETTSLDDPVDWFHLNTAARELENSPRSPYRARLFQDLARAEGDYPSASLHLLNLGLAEADQQEDHSDAVPLLIDRTRLEADLGYEADAHQDLVRVEEAIQRVEPGQRRAILEASATSLRCQLWPAARPQRCLAELSAIISQAHNGRLVATALEARAAVHQQAGNTRAAENNILAAVHLYDSGVSELRSSTVRAKLFNELLTMEVQRDGFAAFDSDERFRAFTLPPARTENVAAPRILGSLGCNLRPYSPKEFEHGLPQYTAVIDYRSSDSRIVADILYGSTKHRVRLPVTSERLMAALAGPSERQWLADRLLQPLVPWLPDGGDLVFIVPPSMWNLDFARLNVGPEGQRLCERYGVSVIPTTGAVLSRARGDAVDLAFDGLTGWLAPRRTAGSRQPPASTIRALLSALPAEAALIKYRLIGDRLYIWLVHHGALTFTSTSISRANLRGLVEELRLWAQQRAIGTSDVSATLYRRLLEPIEDGLRDARDLIVVPDDAMAGMPFALLRKPHEDRFLVEDHSVSISPSASLYALQLRRHEPIDHSNWTVLAVRGMPSDEPSGGRLPLRGDIHETSAIMRLFPGSETVTSDDAPRPATGQGFGVHMYSAPIHYSEHSVVHFAGHWDPAHPTYDLTWMADSLPIGSHTRLVVLAACSTIEGRLRRDHSGFGLARSPLSAGVPAVIASLWQVDDQPTSVLMEHFYEHLRSGLDVANSLRGAQLDLLHGDDVPLRAPTAWASMACTGFGGI